jgi:hypothetical protein
MEENSEYRVTRHKGSGPDGKDTKVIFSHLDEDPARKFYERHLPPTSGTVLALWKPDGSLIAHSESGRRHDHLTIAEAALALGYSADTIRRGVVRGTGPLADLLRDAGRKTNEGWIISLTDEQIARHRKVSISQPTPPQGTPAYARLDQPEPTVPVSTGQHEEVLRERLAGLERRLADRDAEIARQAEENTRLRLEMADQDAAHRAERAEMAASASAERERLLLLLERATVRPSVIERLLSFLRPKGT